jgi:hypothetical protein
VAVVAVAVPVAIDDVAVAVAVAVAVEAVEEATDGEVSPAALSGHDVASVPALDRRLGRMELKMLLGFLA